MPQYTAHVRATTNATADTEDTFIDLDAPASQSCRVKKIKVSSPTTTSQDANIRVRLCRKSAIGTTSGSFTEKEKDVFSPTALVVATVKTGTTAYTAGTITDVLDDVNFNARNRFEWIARDYDDMIVVDSDGIFGVNIAASIASVTINVTVEWEEVRDYKVTCRATSNSVVNTFDAFVMAYIPTSPQQTSRVKRVKVTSPAAASDANIRIQFIRSSNIAFNQLTVTPVKKNPLSPASTLTQALIKDTTVDTSTVGNTVDIIDDFNINARSVFDWVAVDRDDMIVIGPTSTPGDIFTLAISCSAASTAINAVVEWEE